MTEVRSETAAASAACPKCGKQRLPGANSCSRCGLVFSLWNDEVRSTRVNLDERGAEMWKLVADNWTDASRHEAFLKHCLQTNTLAAAGRLYRERLDANPKDAVAAQMQLQILSKAALTLSLSKTEPRVPVTRNRWFWVVVLTAMALGIAAGLYWRRFR